MARKALMLVVLFCACGSDTPTNVAGTYTMSLTVQQNQCGILTNPSGSSSTGVSVKITPITHSGDCPSRVMGSMRSTGFA